MAKHIRFDVLKNMVVHPIDLTVPQTIFVIEQYILYRTGKDVTIIVDQYTNIAKFEKAATIATNYFKVTYKKLWQ